MADRKPCKVEGCSYLKTPGKHFCMWHHLARLPIEAQVENADFRLSKATSEHRARVPRTEWPRGERWCAGCQSFVPLFYCSGSRCKACTSRAAHGARLERVYGITAEEYDALLELQGGVCYVCRRHSRTKRLAVDHDHATGEVRGLLCPDNERGCNHAVLGSLENSVDGALAAARRVVEYLEHTPYARLKAGEAPTAPSVPPTSAWDAFVGVDAPPPY